MPQKLDFMTAKNLQVLEFFFANPLEEFHEREIIRKVPISKGSANRILRNLAQLSFLERTQKGRMVFYRLSTGDPLIKQMKIMFNVWSLRKLMEEIKEKTKKIILFGSCAEGTDAKKSDIDLLIITDQKGPVKESLSRFNRKSDKKIAPLILDMNEFVKMKKEDRPFYERIDRGIVLWENL
jgi:predicted nucleotidyltransferase